MRPNLFLELSFAVASLWFASGVCHGAVAAAAGGPAPWDGPFDHMTAAEQAAIEVQIRKTISGLQRSATLLSGAELSPMAGVQKIAPAIAEGLGLHWPLRINPESDFSRYPGYHYTGQFVDHEPTFPDALLDYSCGPYTYDRTSGYNHAGTDYVLWPFFWYMVDDDAVEVVAAADGTIVLRRDGNADRNCNSEVAESDWNGIVLVHMDGSRTYYLHMKKGSVTQKQIGDTVAAGEYLGVVASSGRSSRPHLHFEVRDAEGNVLDPYLGACNPTTDRSLWVRQPAYFDSGITRLATHSSPPEFGCWAGENRDPEAESPNLQDVFGPGGLVVFAAYYREQKADQPTTYTIYRPDGSVFRRWDHAASQDHRATYWYWTLRLPLDASVGRWTFEADFAGRGYEHFFYVGVEPTPNDTAADFSFVTQRLKVLAVHVPGIGDFSARLRRIDAAGADFEVEELTPVSPGQPGVHSTLDVETGLLQVPAVVVDDQGVLQRYRVRMEVIPGRVPLRLSVLEVNPI